MFTVPDTVLSVTEKLEEAGFEAYIVGGCVRDLILNKQPKDWDVTTNARPEQIQSLFEETFYENTYGTVGVVVESAAPSERVIEVTPYRTEGEYTNKRHPDSVSFSNDISDDLKRRDFTVNALAFRPRTQHFIDLFGGADDLRSGTLRSVGNAHTRFEEDALRMLRAIRFSAEHSFVIEAETMMAIAKHVSLLGHVSRERIRDELLKIVMSKNPQSGLFIAQRLGMLPYIIPELEDGIGCAQNQAHSFDVFEHLLRSMQCAADNDWGLDVRLTALLHDIGKPATRRWSEEKKDWTFYGHEVVGAKMAEKICADLRLPNDLTQKIVIMIRWHMFFSDPDQITLSAVRRVIAAVGKENIWDLLNVRVCDRIGTGRPKAHPFRLRKYITMVEQALRDPISVGQLVLDGKGIMEHTGEKPGPRIGHMLHALLEDVLTDPTQNTVEKLVHRARELSGLNSDELKLLGESGRVLKDEREAAAIKDIDRKYHVS